MLHGSLVPTQFAQYGELLKKSRSRESLYALYDKMLRDITNILPVLQKAQQQGNSAIIF